MRGPPIFLLMKSTGDGYGHGSDTPIVYYFDEQEAEDARREHQEKSDKFAGASSGAYWHVDRVEAATPMKEDA